MEVWLEAITGRKLPSCSVKLTPVTIECHDVKYGRSHAAGYLKIGWRTNISHAVWTNLDQAVNITIVFIGCKRLLDIT